MKQNVGNILLRKLIATFTTTVLLSMLFSLVYIISASEFDYDIGTAFIGWFIVYFMYIVLIIFIYGNVVSIAIEYLQKKNVSATRLAVCAHSRFFWIR